MTQSVLQPVARRCRRLLVTAVVATLTTLVSGCDTPGQPSVLDPTGPAAAQIESLWWLMFWLGLGVFVLVFGLVLYASFRKRTGDPRSPASTPGKWLILFGGFALPIPILAIVVGYNLFVSEAATGPSFAANDAIPDAATSAEWTIDLIGHQFWWEVHYPNQEVVTANEIHIPVGEPVLFRLTSADVIHSFWVPQLHGKLDLIPGQTNRIWIEAEEAGIFRGICAEFCGTQHAMMHLLIIAQPADEFEEWVSEQQQPIAEINDPLLIQGQQVFMGSACVYCHTIQGMNEAAATDTIGPDLTHVASRLTLAAATVENNRGNLGGWILDPHGIKPGVLMPPTRLNSENFRALLFFLESLR